jgi:hypothetical protein
MHLGNGFIWLPDGKRVRISLPRNLEEASAMREIREKLMGKAAASEPPFRHRSNALDSLMAS